MADLLEFERFPWLKVNDYLREIGGSRTREEFYERVLSGLTRLIPCDMAGIFQFLGPCLHQIGADERDQKAYESYYQFRLPWIPNSQELAVPANTIGKINWRTLPYRDSEIFTDFMFPQGYEKSLTVSLPGVKLVTAIHGPGFYQSGVFHPECFGASCPEFLQLLRKDREALMLFSNERENSRSFQHSFAA